MVDSNGSPHIDGKRILVVEDEYFLADETKKKLQALGAVVVGPANGMESAFELIAKHDIDAAILDINLDGQMVFPVAERLGELDIPYLFASGYDASVVPETFKNHPFCEKPLDIERIARLLFEPGRGRGDGAKGDP